jgi:peptidoglycan-N-acetylglucosamine deacetylase
MTRLTLTFDNGPQPGATEVVLEQLAARDLRATFFMVGDRVQDEDGRRSALRVLEAGHRIGNHTLSHEAPLGEGADVARVRREIGESQSVLEALGVKERLFRPNGRGQIGPHLLSAAAVDYLVEHKFTAVTWNCVPRDWEQPTGGWVERAKAALHHAAWLVLVLHDVHMGTGEHLSEFLDEAQRIGVRFTTEFPPSCVPILEGSIQWKLEGTVANDVIQPADAAE